MKYLTLVLFSLSSLLSPLVLHAGGSINSGETHSATIGGPSYSDTWTFQGTAGDHIIVNAVSTSGSLDTYIDLYSPLPVVKEVSTGNWGDQLDWQLEKTGEYTIVVNDYQLNHGGTYNITFLKIPGNVSSPGDPDGGPISSAQTLSGSINTQSDFDAFQFQGQAGERIVVNVVATSGSLDSYIDLYPPGGGAKEVSTGNWGDQCDWQLAQSGLYTIVIQDYQLNDSGEYKITLLKIPGATSTQEDPDGGPIAYGESLKGTIDAPSDMDAYQFFLQPGQRLIVNLSETSGGLDVYMDLHPPGGGAKEVSSGPWGNQLDWQAAQSGLYTLIVQDYQLNHKGKYNITYAKMPGAVSWPRDKDGGLMTSGESRHGLLNMPSDMDLYQFYGVAGERAIINVVETGGSLDTYIELYSPSYVKEISSGPFGNQIDHQLASSGLYTIVVQDYQLNHSGSYNISFSKIPSTERPGIYRMRPSDGSNVTPPSVLLQWDGVGGATGYDVYFGTGVTEGIGVIVTNLPTTSLQSPTVKWNERYFWAVLGHFSGGDVLGPIQWLNGGNFAEMKKLPDGTTVNVGGALVTSAFDGFFFVESDDLASGIRVEKADHALTRWVRADFTGTLQTNTQGERYVAASTVSSRWWRCVEPLGMDLRALGGRDWFYADGPPKQGQKGVEEPHGLNNIGLFVKTWGIVKAPSANTFILEDGSWQQAQVVMQPVGSLAPAADTLVEVTGISSCTSAGSKLQRRIIADAEAVVPK